MKRLRAFDRLLLRIPFEARRFAASGMEGQASGMSEPDSPASPSNRT